MSWLDIIAIIIFIVFMSAKFVWDYYAPIASWVKLQWQRVKALWGEANFLKRTYIISAGAVGVALLYLFARLYLEVLYIDWDNIGGDDGKIRNLAIAFVGTISGIGALFGVYLAILRSEENKRQNDTAEQGLITDRINKATEGLGKNDKDGNPVREVRLGALYALERIAQDSLRDHIRIMKIICGYVRINRLLWDAKVRKIEKEPVQEDIRAAINIIANRYNWTTDKNHLKTEKNQRYKLDLRYCNLHNVDLYDAELSGASLIGAILTRAILVRAKFNDANLSEVNLNDATLIGADMENAKTTVAYAYKVDLSECKNLTQEQLDDMYCGMDVTIDKEKFNRPDHWPKINLSEDAFIKEYNKWKKIKK